MKGRLFDGDWKTGNQRVAIELMLQGETTTEKKENDHAN